MRGEIELDDNVLVIKRITISYTGVDVPADKREAADRALASHHRSCPVTRSFAGCIDVSATWG